MNEQPEQPTSKRAEVMIAALALAVSIFTLGWTIYQHFQVLELEKQINLDPGELIIHAPTDFCIARGFQSFPSDHIIVPIYFENTGKGAKTVDRLALLNAGDTSDVPGRFLLAGYLPDLNLDQLGEHYEVARGITIPERTMERKVLVFQTDHWWQESDLQDFLFRFKYRDGGENRIDLKLAYFDSLNKDEVRWRNSQSLNAANDPGIFLPMIVYRTINNLAMLPGQADHLLQQADTQSNHDLVAALQGEHQGNYHADCFPIGDFPESEHP